MKKIKSILYYLFFAVTGIFLITGAALIWFFSFAFDKRLYLVHLYTQYWGSFLFAVVPSWKIRIIGREKIDSTKALVFVSNHQSEFDIVVVSRLHAHFKWVSKAEVFQTPIIGWNMSLNRYIKLKRGDKKSILQMVKDCGKMLRNGSSVFIFPEGTRSSTGLVRNMAAGAFTIAKREQVAIQPIVINGTKDIMVKGSWMLNFKANVTLEVLDEIPYETFKNMEAADIATMVREEIIKHVWEHQQN